MPLASSIPSLQTQTIQDDDEDSTPKAAPSGREQRGKVLQGVGSYVIVAIGIDSKLLVTAFPSTNPNSTSPHAHLCTSCATMLLLEEEVEENKEDDARWGLSGLQVDHDGCNRPCAAKHPFLPPGNQRMAYDKDASELISVGPIPVTVVTKRHQVATDKWDKTVSQGRIY
ncbi:hypothetical protein K503DRAFT_805969 [Rhizopogon vinicolor AM-OR11-026]|uniref:Uncharacterized protein n=1 Tax=Rhizopogon vinicolor AM-OR11-026 TaxID=1314800 RepID=A0A1B7MG32_9AGAM|nr:hypothetical protein K503DRAFT_805969 [Rhizopogon vinicolor AM-OR11-026]